MAIVGIDNPASATAADIAALPADAFAGATADDLAAMPAMGGMDDDADMMAQCLWKAWVQTLAANPEWVVWMPI